MPVSMLSDVDYFIKTLDGLMLVIVLQLQFLSAPLDYSIMFWSDSISKNRSEGAVGKHFCCNDHNLECKQKHPTAPPSTGTYLKHPEGHVILASANSKD